MSAYGSGYVLNSNGVTVVFGTRAYICYAHTSNLRIHIKHILHTVLKDGKVNNIHTQELVNFDSSIIIVSTTHPQTKNMHGVKHKEEMISSMWQCT